MRAFLYDRAHAIAYLELLKNAMQMALRGANRDRQLVGNLLIAEPATTTSQHFELRVCSATHSWSTTIQCFADLLNGR